MDFRSSSDSSGMDSSGMTSPQLTLALYDPLETALKEQCAERYDAAISVQCVDVRRVDDDQNDVSVMRVKVACRGLTEMPVRLLVTCSTTSSYDVVCTVQDGSTHRFSYHLPGGTAPSVRQLVPLAQDLATFLRGELESRLGRLLLQSPARPPRTERGISIL